MTEQEKKMAGIGNLIEESTPDQKQRIRARLMVVQNILDQYEREAVSDEAAARMVKMIAERF